MFTEVREEHLQYRFKTCEKQRGVSLCVEGMGGRVSTVLVM